MLVFTARRPHVRPGHVSKPAGRDARRPVQYARGRIRGLVRQTRRGTTAAVPRPMIGACSGSAIMKVMPRTPAVPQVVGDSLRGPKLLIYWCARQGSNL